MTELIGEIKKFLSKRNNELAMMTALMKGRIEQEVGRHEAGLIDAELVLTKDRTSWNLAGY